MPCTVSTFGTFSCYLTGTTQTLLSCSIVQAIQQEYQTVDRRSWADTDNVTTGRQTYICMGPAHPLHSREPGPLQSIPPTWQSCDRFPAPAGELWFLFSPFSLTSVLTFAPCHLCSCDKSWKLRAGTCVQPGWRLWSMLRHWLGAATSLNTSTDCFHHLHTTATADWAFNFEQFPHKSEFTSLSLQPVSEPCC